MFDEVQLIVAKPVLREIDYRKNKSNDRVGKRARATSAMFRAMLPDGRHLVHTKSPRVILSVEPQHKYAKGLDDELDYTERDDQLVGTVYEYAQHNPTSDVRLLTHDTTPQFTAGALQLTVELISDDWLLPPETTKAEKKVKALEAENARLKQSEPSFSVRFLAQTHRDAERYEASYTWFDPLTDAEVDALTQCLRDHFPLETDFGSREPVERATPPGITNLFMGAKRTFVPTTDEAIAEYRDVKYPQWLESCEAILRNHHLSLQRGFPALEFSFVVENRGTRPAADALITISAKGDLQVKPPWADDGNGGLDAGDGESSNWKHETLPGPPVAPRGHWRKTGGVDLVDMEALVRSVSNVTPDLARISHTVTAEGFGGSVGAEFLPREQVEREQAALRPCLRGARGARTAA